MRKLTALYSQKTILRCKDKRASASTIIGEFGDLSSFVRCSDKERGSPIHDRPARAKTASDNAEFSRTEGASDGLRMAR